MNNKQLKLLKVLAFPVTAAFSFGIFAADIQAETSQTDEMRQDADANTASEMNGETFVEEQPTKAEEPTLKVQEDAPLKEWVSPSKCDPESGVEGVYLGEWSDVGENQVMILEDVGFTNAEIKVEGNYLILHEGEPRSSISVALNEGEIWSYDQGVVNGKGAEIVTNYDDSEYGKDHIVEGADYYIETKYRSGSGEKGNANGNSYELNPPVEIKARDVLVPGKATLTWKNKAELKDGTLADLVMVIDDIRVRLLDDERDDRVRYLTENDRITLLSGTENTVQTDTFTYPEGGTSWIEFATGIPAAINIRIHMYIVPSDGSSLADHDVDQMIMYFTDIDGRDRIMDKDYGTDDRNFRGLYEPTGTRAEFIRLEDGVKGPVIVYDRTWEFEDYPTWGPSLNPADEEVNMAKKAQGHYDNNHLYQDTNYYLNEARLIESGGTWFSGSHATESKNGEYLNSLGEDPERYAGFITLVDPAGFTFRAGGVGFNTTVISKARFDSKIRLINEGPYPNTVTIFDTSTGEDREINSVDGSQNPDSTTDDHDNTYNAPYKQQKTLKMKAEDGFAISKISISKGVDGSDKDEVEINIADIPVGGSYESPEYPGMIIRRISDTEIEMDVMEEYTDGEGNVKKGYLTDHTIKVASVKTPVAQPATSQDYEDVPQTGTPTFTADEKSIPDGATENKIEKITLVDKEGNEVDTVTVPEEGTYELEYNDDGTFKAIKFTPEPGYVGKTSGVKVRGYDSNGFSADTTYTPEVLPTPRYKITYDPNGGTGDMKDDVYKFDEEEMPSKENEFTYDDHIFAGFKAYVKNPETGEETVITDENGDPIIFESAEDMKKYLDGKPGDTEIRMEAQWKQTVTYVNPVNGEVYMPKTDFMDGEDGEGEPAAPSDPEMPGATFAGWKRIPDGKGNITYEAQWTKTVTYVDITTGEIIQDTITFNYGDPEPAAPANPTKPGYTFTGWSRFEDENGNIFYEAQWGRTVTYVNPVTGEIVQDTIKFGFDEDEPAAPANPTMPGATFAGWKRSEDANGNILYEAMWQKTVTYIDPVTGAVYMVVTPFDYNAAEPAGPANPTREGFVFMGWTRTVDEFGNIVYEAQWAPVQGEKASPAQVTSGVQTDTQTGLGFFSTLMATSTGLFAGLARKKKDEE